MVNFLKAFFFFLIWSAAALWFHQTQSNKLFGNCASKHQTETSPKINLDNNNSEILSDKKPAINLNDSLQLNQKKIKTEAKKMADSISISNLENLVKKKTLHLNFKDESFKSDSTLTTYITNIKEYLVIRPKTKINIEGHTDNIGYYQNNLIIGLQNANKLKGFLVTKGINAANILTSSKGESKPIATKLTEEGRAKNRRIEITLN